jgi:hypothetical protein
MIHYPAYKVAVAHVAPVFLDTDRSVEKACSVIEEAAGNGARLIAFFDISTLSVDRSPRPPATFIDERQDSARSTVPPDCGCANPKRPRIRRTRPEVDRLWKMALDPPSCLLALPGWLYLYLSSGPTGRNRDANH